MDIIQELYNLGAKKAAKIPVSKIPFQPELRKMCEQNACGNYGKNYACPPNVPSVEKLIEQIREYNTAVVFQTVSKLEDSYDFEGMTEAGYAHSKITYEIRDLCEKTLEKDFLIIGSGKCKVCSQCSLILNNPCEFPKKKVISLSAYGIYASKLAKVCEMNYINGENTVTYFSLILVKE